MVSCATLTALFQQERPIDTVVDGFIHLQQYHVNEVIRGLAGIGSYRLRPGYPLCDKVSQYTDFVMEPDDIVDTLLKPSNEVKKYTAFCDVL